MAIINITTFIQAPVEKVFELSRNLEMLRKSMVAIQPHITCSSTSNGVLAVGDRTTWKWKFFYKTRVTVLQVTKINSPVLMVQKQVEGNYKTMRMERHFKPCDNGTIMIDVIKFSLKMGMLGALFEMPLQNHIKKAVKSYARFLKEQAEKK